MIAPEQFYRHLKKQGIDFFTGVPDSLFKNLLLYLQQQEDPSHHIITANEGQSVALAAGYYLATGRLPLVYLQNSGLGNIVNPLTSLTDKEAYSIPLLLLIGWRGIPGVKDEPQHKKMGRITEQLLQTLEIPFYVLQADSDKSLAMVTEAAAKALELKQAVALLVPGDIFEDYTATPPVDQYPLGREEVIRQLVQQCKGDEVVVCTTGKTGREFYELNEAAGNKLPKNLLCVGAMGLANHIALGLDMHQHHRVIMLDGDGALLMHLGTLATLGKQAGDSFLHIVINNGCHESVGGQQTLGFDIDLCAIGKACGYTATICIHNEKQLGDWLKSGFDKPGKQFVEIRVNAKSRTGLSRPKESPVERKEQLMQLLKK